MPAEKAVLADEQSSSIHADAKRTLAVLCLYALVSISLLGPFASSSILPEASDHANHTALIVEAKLALTEGQFPICVAPWSVERLRLPIFQYYSSSIYTIAGLIYKHITTDNPWTALKVTYFLFFLLASYFTWSVGLSMGLSGEVSFLTGLLYITAPYLLVNVYGRGAFTEALAQLLLPCVTYAAICLYRRPGPIPFVASAVAWFFLATFHFITFAYGLLFAALFAAFAYFRRLDRLVPLAVLAASIVAGMALAAFQLIPSLTTELMLKKALPNPYGMAWLTPLPELLSLGSTAPRPLAPDVLAPYLRFNAGFPMLLGVAGCLILRLTRKMPGPVSSRVVDGLFGVTALALFMTWSPLDFWQYLPSAFYVVQFPYRLLTFAVLPGTLLAGICLNHIAATHGKGPLGAALALVLASTASQIPNMPPNPRTVENIIATPDMGYGKYGYLLERPPSRLPSRAELDANVSLTYPDGWLQIDSPIEIPRSALEESAGTLYLKGAFANPSRPDGFLSLIADGKLVETKSFSVGPIELEFPLAAILAKSASPVIKLAFTSTTYTSPRAIDPRNPDGRKLMVNASELKIRSQKPSNFILLDRMRSHCFQKGETLECNVNLPAEGSVQLPMLYYPDLLDITVNGAVVPYDLSTRHNYVLATVKVAPGQSQIRAAWRGSGTGNMVSAAGWIGIVLLVLIPAFRRWRSRPVAATAAR